MRYCSLVLLLLSLVGACEFSSSKETSVADPPVVGSGASSGGPLASKVVEATVEALGCAEVGQVDPRKDRPDLVPMLDKMIGGKAANLTMVTCEASKLPPPRCDAIAEAYHPEVKRKAHHFGVSVRSKGELRCVRLYDHEGLLTADLMNPREVVIPPYPLEAAMARLEADGRLTLEPHGAAGCKLPSDLWSMPQQERQEALSKCLATGKSTWLHLRAAASVPYERVEALHRAVAGSGGRSALSLGPPLGLPRVACDDEQLIRRPEPKGSADDDRPAVVLTGTALLIGEEAAPVITFANAEALARSGFSASHKRCGAGDYFLAPLAARLPAVASGLVLIADLQTPYRALWEVYYTFTRTRGGPVHFMVVKRVQE